MNSDRSTLFQQTTSSLNSLYRLSCLGANELISSNKTTDDENDSDLMK